MLGLGCRSSYRIWFEKCDILTVLSLFILALAMFVINNFSFFQTNLSVHCVNTRLKKNLHKPLINISSSQKATTYSVIMVFNTLLLYIKKLQYDKLHFKNALIYYLLVHTFYSYEDFLSY